MNISTAKTLAARLACAAAAAGCLAITPSAANADVTWLVNGTFDDGTTVTGTFDINVYGYLESADLKTETKGVFTGFEYTTASPIYIATGVTFVDFQPSYQSDLHLTFADNLGVAEADNPIIGGEMGPSYECQGSYSCYVPSGGNTRYIASGSASAGAVPEPETWALMISGFGLAGAALRGRRRALARA